MANEIVNKKIRQPNSIDRGSRFLFWTSEERSFYTINIVHQGIRIEAGRARNYIVYSNEMQSFALVRIPISRRSSLFRLLSLLPWSK